MKNVKGKLLVVFGLLALVACQSTSTRPEGSNARSSAQPSMQALGRPLKIGIVTWGGYAGGIVANNGFKAKQESIFFKEYGIEVELRVIDDYPLSREAFRRGGDVEGGIDVMWSTVDTFALEYDALRELDPKVIMQCGWSRGGDAIVATEKIQTMADLKGKRLAVAESTPSHFYALHALKQAELKPTDVNFVFTDTPIWAVQLFKQGNVDAAVSWSPDIYDAARARPGGHILRSTKEDASLIADVLVARGDLLGKHPDVVAKFLLGWFHGVDEAKRNPERSYPLMAAGFEGVDEAAAKSMLGDVALTSYAQNLKFFEVLGDQPRGYADIYLEAHNLWRDRGKISGDRKPGDTIDTKHLLAIRTEAETRFGKSEDQNK